MNPASAPSPAAGLSGADPRLVAGALAAGLAAVHLAGPRLRVLDAIPRSRWLSLSGGVSVAYVFVHLLPEIQRMGTYMGEHPIGVGFLERHVYLVSLAGFLVYYGVEQAATRRSEETPAEALAVFWLHLGSFAAYNLLVGYLLFHREEPGVGSLVLFGVAMGLHFLVNDWGLYHHHGRDYHRYGRWFLAAAVLAGAGVGSLVRVDRRMLAVLFAFLAGGVILNVIKEELPAERESRFWAFAAGSALYTAILLLR